MQKIVPPLVAIIALQLIALIPANATETLVMGAINADGTSQIPTRTFSVQHPSPGRYLITFAPDTFNNAQPHCIIMPLGDTARVKRIWQSGNTCDFTLINSTTLLAADAIFNFMAAPITR